MFMFKKVGIVFMNVCLWTCGCQLSLFLMLSIVNCNMLLYIYVNCTFDHQSYCFGDYRFSSSAISSVLTVSSQCSSI